MQSGGRKKIDDARLNADLAAAGITSSPALSPLFLPSWRCSSNAPKIPGARARAVPPAWRRFYFSTRMNWPVDASTDTVSFELSRFAPKMTCQIS